MDKQRRKFKKARLLSKRQVHPDARCWDWMLHSGNVHYACNSSTFSSYTKIDMEAGAILGFDERVVFGIGTVNLVARRSQESDEMCTITLHDVLRIPSMLCNGISESRLCDAELSVAKSKFGVQISHPQTGLQLCHGTRFRDMHKLALVGDPQGESLLEQAGEFMSISVSAKEEEVARLGRAVREIHREEHWVGPILGDQYGLRC